MKSEAKTVAAYIQGLDEERRAPIKAVRKLIRANLPKGYNEVMRWGMITYEVPLSSCPDTYNGEPLMYAGLSSQKHHISLHIMGLYCFADLNKRIVDAWKQRGTRLNMGKSCIRFSRLEQLELDLVGDAIAAIPMERFIENQNAIRGKKKQGAIDAEK